jgi:hypothetical protein
MEKKKGHELGKLKKNKEKERSHSMTVYFFKIKKKNVLKM